jgi:hypothetical protein
MLCKCTVDFNTSSRADAKHIWKENTTKNTWPDTKGDAEPYSLYKEPNIVEDIKIRRLGWLELNKNGRRKDSKKGFKWKLPHHKIIRKTKN